MTPATWRPQLAQTLESLAVVIFDFKDDWWIIGSAAAALSGADLAEVRDVDVLLSKDDAGRLLSRWRAAPGWRGGRSRQFRSLIYERFEHAPLAIEVIAGFEISVGGFWRTVQPLTRELNGGFFTPPISEQIDLLGIMARPKDGPRVAALRALLAQSELGKMSFP